MSLIQASVAANHAVVAVDTWGHQIDGQGEKVGEGHVAKMLPLPHMPAVVAARGYTLLSSMVAGYAFVVPDFDFLLNHFETGMTQIMHAGSSTAAHPFIYAEGELVLCGWSNRARMMLAFYAHKPAGGAFTLSEIVGGVYAPPPHADGTMPAEPGDMEDRVAIARLQAERIRTESGGAAGGDLVVATLTRNGVSVELVRGFTTDAAGARRTGGKALAAV